MKITFHGAARTVTGSQHLVEVNGYRILLDCGLYQGKRKLAFERNRNFPFTPTHIDAVILSHAHIDHSGNIPSLVKNGYTGPIYATHATRDLCATMLPDSGHIQEKDAQWVNKKRKPHEDPVEPLYTQDDAFESIECFVSMSYRRSREILEGIELTFYDAGHMLGSACVVLDVNDHDAGRDIRLVFSGDIGRKGLPILRDPTILDYADVLIMESTYGDRVHEPIDVTDQTLKSVIQHVCRTKGVLVVPAFAVGRTQQLVYELQKMYSTGELPRIPIFVDSPLAIDATAVFRQHPEVYDRETREYMLHYDDEDPFGFDLLTYTRKVEDSKALNTMDGPFIVISASGMAEAGRILHHLKNRIEDERNVILITGWQAPDTLGRRLVDGITPVRIFGQEYNVRAEVHTLNALSGHADSNELVEWVAGMQKRPRQIFLVHGELEPATVLQKRLQSELEIMDVQIPDMHEQVEIV
ncbi:MAG: MBL fold metallo-hydrolase [Phototrophicales bacterium]|nr:MAG: MBL fold metallo-hydrolase [Phototrophicales bacterium]